MQQVECASAEPAAPVEQQSDHSVSQDDSSVPTTPPSSSSGKQHYLPSQSSSERSSPEDDCLVAQQTASELCSSPSTDAKVSGQADLQTALPTTSPVSAQAELPSADVEVSVSTEADDSNAAATDGWLAGRRPMCQLRRSKAMRSNVPRSTSSSVIGRRSSSHESIASLPPLLHQLEGPMLRPTSSLPNVKVGACEGTRPQSASPLLPVSSDEREYHLSSAPSTTSSLLTSSTPSPVFGMAGPLNRVIPSPDSVNLLSCSSTPTQQCTEEPDKNAQAHSPAPSSSSGGEPRPLSSEFINIPADEVSMQFEQHGLSSGTRVLCH